MLNSLHIDYGGFVTNTQSLLKIKEVLSRDGFRTEIKGALGRGSS